MEEFQEQKDEIMVKITSLQQQVRYCMNNYDYHHKNNELNILQEKLNRLKDCEVVFKDFVQKMKDLKELTNTAQQLCDKVDNMRLDSSDDGHDDKENRDSD